MSDEFDYPLVIKLDGNLAEDPEAYILANYGAAVRWTRAEAHPDGDCVFRLVGFVEREGIAALFAYCAAENFAGPLPGKRMIRWWPDAPGYVLDLPPASAWFPNGIECYSETDGTANWAIGRGEAYFPETGSGPCAAWVSSEEGPSDLLEGWGWLDGTNYHHLAPIFERVPVEDDDGEPEPPDPETVDLTEVVEALDRQTVQLGRIAAALEGLLAWETRP